jgi:ectoine hydroxylase-related dioxygenase (phytanoyl-CoA dioxygenase family)
VIGTLETDGFCIVPNVFDKNSIVGLIATLDHADMARSKRGAEVFGARNLLDIPEIRTLANSPEIIALVDPVLGQNSIPIRGIFFDKTPGANWPVAWHQDLTLAVTDRRDLPGWTNWSVKRGAHHVNPPVSVLENMVTLRVMLDDCDADNGPLRVQPGLHRLGRLSREQIVECCASQEEQECLGWAGDVLMMRPLLVHASSAARNPRHRRVVHIEFVAADVVPENLLAKPPMTGS